MCRALEEPLEVSGDVMPHCLPHVLHLRQDFACTERKAPPIWERGVARKRYGARPVVVTLLAYSLSIRGGGESVAESFWGMLVEIKSPADPETENAESFDCHWCVAYCRIDEPIGYGGRA